MSKSATETAREKRRLKEEGERLLRAHGTDHVNEETGEVTEGALNRILVVKTKRANGSVREQQDFRYCPSLAEQHTAHLTNINYLMEKYQPDELAAYIAQRNQHRLEVKDHDFSQEPNLQEAHNILYRSKQEFKQLPVHVQNQFRNHLEFLKFIDNPANEQIMLQLGILKPEQVEKIKIPETGTITTPPQTTPTQEKEENSKEK